MPSLFRRSPAFVLASVLILSLGLAATISVVTIVKVLFLSPLPYPDSQRIVRVMNSVQGGLRANVSGPDFKDWRDGQSVFAAISRFSGGEVAATVNGRGVFTEVYAVSPGFFEVFSLKPAAGRLLDPAEFTKGSGDTAVISHEFWRQHFAEDRGAIGQSLKISKRLYTIVGVLPAGFGFPNHGSIYLSASIEGDNQNRTAHNFRAVGRIRPDVSLEAAQSQMNAIAARIEAANPATHRNRGIGLVSVEEFMARPYRQTLYLLLAAAAAILLIACSNVSSLLFAQSSARAREFAVRASLGATPWAIAKSLLAEGLLLSIASALLSLTFSSWFLGALTPQLPAGFPRVEELRLDGRVAVFAFALSLAASFLFTLFPAWRSSRIDILSALKASSQKGAIGGSSAWFRKSMAVAQIALSLVLLSGALLLTRSLYSLASVELGLSPEKVLVSYVHVPASTLEEHQAAARTFSQMLADLRTTPGVQSVSAIMGMPGGRYGSNGAYFLASEDLKKDFNSLPQAGFRVISPGFFSTVGATLRVGRDFAESDAYDRPFVAIVNESLVRRSFPNENPIGKQIVCGLDSPKPMTIVGVVSNIRHNGAEASYEPELYMPYHQHPFFANELQVALRAAGDPAPYSETVRAAASRVNRDIAVSSVTLESMLNAGLSAPRFRLLLLGLMAVFAVILAAAGLFALLSYLVAARHSEFGLRLALGASPRRIAQLVLREAGFLLACGLGIGFLLLPAALRFVRGLLFGVPAYDPASLAASALVLALTVCAAALIPLRRALNSDPMVALRAE